MQERRGDGRLRTLLDQRSVQVKQAASRHGVTHVRVFGSVARGDEHPSSDVDLLVDLLPGTRPFELLRLGAELEELLGVRVDVGTPESLRAEIRDEVLAEAVDL